MLLVLFIMFITSLLWLLVSQYVRNMITISALFSEYYTTYFIAYWWLELWLTQVKYHNFWFEDELVFTWFLCESSDCQFDMEIVSRSRAVWDTYLTYTWCDAMGTAWNYYSLSAGECFITPLFYDISEGFDAVTYDDINATELWLMDLDIHHDWDGSGSGEYVVRIIDEDTENFDVLVEEYMSNWSPYETAAADLWFYTWSVDNKNFFIIANATWDTKNFCLEVASWSELVKNYVTISSIWSDSNSYISFGAIKLYNVDSFNCFWTINP